MPKSTVADLSFRTDWRGVSVEVADAFAAGCGVNLLRPCRQIEFLVRREKTYMFKAEGNERRMYAKLLVLLEQWVLERDRHH